MAGIILMAKDDERYPDLSSGAGDFGAAIVRALAAPLDQMQPGLGGLAAQVVNELIPGKRIDRIADFSRALGAELSQMKEQLKRVEDRLRTAEGADLFEDAIRQAARALTPNRRRAIASLLAKSLSAEEFRYAGSKKLLSILEELTDPELLFLISYRYQRHGDGYREFMERHREVLLPASREIGAAAGVSEKRTMQDAYTRKLDQLGLVLGGHGQGQALAPLGHLLLEYIGEVEDA